MDPYEKEQRRERRRARRAELVRTLRPVVPLLLVNVVAVGGQLAYGLDAYRQDSWPWPATFAVALLAALTAETVSLYVNWHAHDALLLKATATAARRRAQAYLIAAVVAAINYSHFSAGWKPTPAAILTAGCSLLSPWLWGLHTRRAQRVQLLREGHADTAGAVFGAARYLWFPRLTLGARRYSIFHGIVDPAQAWRGHIAETQARKVARDAARAPARQDDSPPLAATLPAPPTAQAETPRAEPPGTETPPRPRTGRGVATDDEHLAAARAWAAAHPDQPITSRRALAAAAEIDGVKPGSNRAAALYERYLTEQAPGLRSITGGAR